MKRSGRPANCEQQKLRIAMGGDHIIPSLPPNPFSDSCPEKKNECRERVPEKLWWSIIISKEPSLALSNCQERRKVM